MSVYPCIPQAQGALHFGLDVPSGPGRKFPLFRLVGSLRPHQADVPGLHQVIQVGSGITQGKVSPRYGVNKPGMSHFLRTCLFGCGRYFVRPFVPGGDFSCAITALVIPLSRSATKSRVFY